MTEAENDYDIKVFGGIGADQVVPSAVFRVMCYPIVAQCLSAISPRGSPFL